MQQATTLRTSTRTTASRSIVSAILVLAVVVTIAVLGLSTRAPHGAPITAVVVNPAYNRLFESERMYVLSASEYIPLGETYTGAAVTGEHTAKQRLYGSRMQADEQAAMPSTAEYASGIWGEEYRVASAESVPARAETGHFASRTFADEADAPVLVQAYSGLVVGEDYLPLTERAAPATLFQAAGTRSFADQRLGVVSAAEYAELPFAEDYSLVDTLH